MSTHILEKFSEDFRRKFDKYREIPFDYKSWNCLHLAKQLHDDYFRGRGLQTRFPDVIDKFQDVKEDDASAEISKWVPIYCNRVNVLTNGCLVVLVSQGVYNLGSYYEIENNGVIYYMGKLGAEAETPRKLSSFIASIWEIKSNPANS